MEHRIYSWADINLKLTDVFSGITADFRETFEKLIKFKQENVILREENEKLKQEIRRLQNHE